MVLADWEDRRQAVTTKWHAFVQASAGTGKTHTLSLRAVYLLLAAPFLPPVRPASRTARRFEEIEELYHASNRSLRLRAAQASVRSLVLTTFTRKAAAEMQSRLFRYLDLLSSTPDFTQLKEQTGRDPLFFEICEAVMGELEASGISRENCFGRLRLGAEALAESACEFQIATLHSLAASLLKRHPLESGLPAGIRFAEEDQDEGGSLADLVIERWWECQALSPGNRNRENEKEDSKSLQADLATVLAVISPYQLREWFRQVYQFPRLIAQLRELTPPDPAVSNLIRQGCQELGERLRSANGKRIAGNAEVLLALSARFHSLDDTAWADACLFFQENRQSLFLDGSKTTESVKSAIRALPPHLLHFFETLNHVYSPCSHLCILGTWGKEWRVWLSVLERFREWSTLEAIKEVGIVGFDEMIRLAADLLEKNPLVRAKERRRLRALLVDEFQDTDPDQLRLLTALLRRCADSPHEVTAFFVGDTKQSIYRFRGADVQSTDWFREHFESLIASEEQALKHLSLRTSFRSQKTVTDFVNALFSDPLRLADRKSGLQALNLEAGELPEWVWIDQDKEGNRFPAARGRRLAALETARLIKCYIQKPGACYRDVLVLVRTGRELDALLPILQQAGIPVVSCGARTLYRQPEVTDVLNLLITLFNPLDTLAVGAVMRSPMVQLSDTEIHDLIHALEPSRVINSTDPLPAFLPEPARRRLEALRELDLLRSSLAMSDWLRAVRRFLPAALYSDPSDLEGRAHARINRLFEAFLAQMVGGRTPPLAWLLKQRARASDSRFDADQGEDVSVADDSIEAVRVMTIHKAKGLEAKYTIVYGWSSVLQEIAGTSGANRGAIVLSTGGLGSGPLEFSLPWGPVSLCSADLRKAAKEEELRGRAEAIRLAYVATTRARTLLTLVCWLPKRMQIPDLFADLPLRFRDQDQARQDPFLSTFGVRVVANDAEIIAGPAATSVDLDRNVYRAVWQQRHDRANEQARPVRARPSVAEEEPNEHNPAPSRHRNLDDRSVAIAAGQLVHGYLERWLLEPGFELEKLAWLGKQQLKAPLEALLRAESILAAFYADRIPDQPLFAYRPRARRATVLGREVPFYITHADRRWNGVIDLVLEENGVIKGVDYKASPEKDEVSASYSQQASIYTAALKQIFPDRSVSFEFWWLWPPVPKEKARKKR